MWLFNFPDQVVINTNDPEVISNPDSVEITEEAGAEILMKRDKHGAKFARGDNGEIIVILPEIGGDVAETEEVRYARISQNVRYERDQLLSPALDALGRHDNQKTYGIPTTLSDEEARALAFYAEDLRKVPEQAGFPYSIIWPAVPPKL